MVKQNITGAKPTLMMNGDVKVVSNTKNYTIKGVCKCAFLFVFEKNRIKY